MEKTTLWENKFIKSNILGKTKCWKKLVGKTHQEKTYWEKIYWGEIIHCGKKILGKNSI